MSGARFQLMWVAPVAAALEVATGTGLVFVPSLIATLLFGSGMNAIGDLVGRISGLMIACLALGYCLRAFEGEKREAVAPLLALSLLAAVFLIYVGIAGLGVGVLLWPAAATHLVLAVLLARIWIIRPAG